MSSSRQPQLAAGERHARRVAERRALAAREREVGGEVVGQPLAVEPAQQRRHLGVEARRHARRRRTGRSSRTESRERQPVREAVGVVVHPVEALPGERRQHHERARLAAGAARRQARHGERPHGAVIARRARARRTRPSASCSGSWMRKRPATRPPWRSGFGSPSRETTKSKLRSTGPTSRWAKAPGGDGRQRAAQREVAHRHAGARARHGRARHGLRRLGQVARPVAHGDRERVVALGRGLGALGAGAHAAVPDGGRGPGRRGSAARCAACRRPVRNTRTTGALFFGPR